MLSEINNLSTDLGNVTSLFQTERYKKVLKEAAVLKKRYPQNAFPYLVAGKTHARMGNRKMAENQLRKAIRLNPSLWAAYRELGILLVSTGRVPGCLRLIDRLRRNVNAFESEKLCVIFSALISADRGDIAEAQNELRENLIYCWNDPLALEILRMQNELANNDSLCWQIDIQGSLTLGSLITLPSNITYRFKALALTEDEAVSHILNNLRFSHRTLITCATSLNNLWSNDRLGIYQMAFLSRS